MAGDDAADGGRRPAAGGHDQALFSDSYGDVKGWEESLRATYVAPFGLGAYMLQNFVPGHVIYSFGAPTRSPKRCVPPSLTGRGSAGEASRSRWRCGSRSLP
jgi:hypothetical protein